MNDAFPHEAPGAPHASPGTDDGAVLLSDTDAGCAGSRVVDQLTPGRKNRPVLRGPVTLSPKVARLATTPSRHPQGYQDCSNAFGAGPYAVVAGQASRGLPTFADVLRATPLTSAVVESVARRFRAEVPA